MKKTVPPALLLLSVIIVALTGCGSGSATATVTGVVSYKGAPVEGASVIFSPSGIGKGMISKAVTDAAGKYSLQLIPDRYSVGISKTESLGAALSEEEAHAQAAAGETPAVVTVKDHLPVKYKSGATSGLNAQVTSDGKNEFTFELK